MRLWLKEAREKAGLSQKAMGIELGMSQNYYSQIELGQRQDSLKLPVMVKLSKLLNISLEQIAQFESARVSA